VLRGEKKDKQPKEWKKKRNPLKRMRDYERDKETKLARGRGPGLDLAISYHIVLDG